MRPAFRSHCPYQWYSSFANIGWHFSRSNGLAITRRGLPGQAHGAEPYQTRGAAASRLPETFQKAQTFQAICRCSSPCWAVTRSVRPISLGTKLLSLEVLLLGTRCDPVAAKC